MHNFIYVNANDHRECNKNGNNNISNSSTTALTECWAKRNTSEFTHARDTLHSIDILCEFTVIFTFLSNFYREKSAQYLAKKCHARTVCSTDGEKCTIYIFVSMCQSRKLEQFCSWNLFINFIETRTTIHKRWILLFFLDAHERIRRSMRNEILSRSPCICSMNETERLTELLLHVYDCSRVSTRW